MYPVGQELYAGLIHAFHEQAQAPTAEPAGLPTGWAVPFAARARYIARMALAGMGTAVRARLLRRVSDGRRNTHARKLPTTHKKSADLPAGAFQKF